MSCPVPRPFPDFDRKLVIVPSRVPSRILTGCPGPSHGKISSLSCCPFVPGQLGNFCPFVPKSCTVPSRWKPYIIQFVCPIFWDMASKLKTPQTNTFLLKRKAKSLSQFTACFCAIITTVFLKSSSFVVLH